MDSDETQHFDMPFSVGLPSKISSMKKFLVTIVLSLSLLAKTMADEGMGCRYCSDSRFIMTW